VLVSAPVLYMSARVLLATFSRGAIIGLGVMAAMLVVVRSRALALVIILGMAGVVTMAPELLPESMSERMSQTSDTDSGALDKSSQTRLILWDAAIKITLEHPLLGTGFKTFPLLKGLYTEQEVEESDNHNMFLYISSQMGLPALAVFLAIVLRMMWLGIRLHSRAATESARIIGLGAAATAAAVLGVNMFGSRMVDIAVNANVWVTLVVLAHLWREQVMLERAGLPPLPSTPNPSNR
jgi:O-antigen ligase